MKKLIALLMIMCLLLTVLVACKDKAKDNTASDAPSTSSVVGGNGSKADVSSTDGPSDTPSDTPSDGGSSDTASTGNASTGNASTGNTSTGNTSTDAPNNTSSNVSGNSSTDSSNATSSDKEQGYGPWVPLG